MEESTLPHSEIHLVTVGDVLYKVKLYAKQDKNAIGDTQKKFWSRNDVRYDLKRVITFILQYESRLFPIRSDTFVAYPYRKLWHKGQDLLYYRKNSQLIVSQYEFILFLERIPDSQVNNDTPQISGANKRSSATRSKRKNNANAGNNNESHHSSNSSVGKRRKVAHLNPAREHQLQTECIDAKVNTVVKNCKIAPDKVIDQQVVDDSCSSSTVCDEEDTTKGNKANTSNNKAQNDDNSSLIDADIGRLEELANRNYQISQDRGIKNESAASRVLAFLNRLTH